MDNASFSSQPKSSESAAAAKGVFAAVYRRLSANKRSVLALLDQMVVSGTSLLTTIIVGRFCGSDGLGLFTLAMSAVILTRGMQETLVSTPYTVFRTRLGDRMEPAVHAGGALVGALLLGAIVTTIAVVVAAALSLGAMSSSVITLAWALAITVPFALAREFARRFDMARMKMGGALAVDAGVASIQIALLVTLALQGRLSGSAAIVLIGLACGIIVVVWAVNRRREFVVDRSQLASSIKHDWGFGRWLLADQMICFAQLYAMHWLLTVMIGTSATGIFAACASIAALASPFLQGIGNYLSPQFADTVSSGSRRETMRLYWRTTMVLLVAVTGFALLATYFGSDLLWLLYHDPVYDGYAAVVGLLAFRMAFGIPALGAHHAVVAMEAPRGSAAATLAGMIVAFCLAIPLIHLYGVIGAAIAVFLGTGVECVALVAVFKQKVSDWKWCDDA